MKVLKEKIPLELLEKCVKAVGLRNLQDNSSFTKAHIRIKDFTDLFPDLANFYQPYRARQHLNEPLSTTKAISILKLLLSSHQLHLSHQMKVVGGARTSWYSICTPQKIDVVAFDGEVSFK